VDQEIQTTHYVIVREDSTHIKIKTTYAVSTSSCKT